MQDFRQESFLFMKNGASTEETHLPYCNVFVEVLYVDDPDIEGMYVGSVNFPVELYRRFALALQKNFATPIAIDDAEPFGALMAFQRHLVWRLVK
jgi:hypothetical protein